MRRWLAVATSKRGIQTSGTVSVRPSASVTITPPVLAAARHVLLTACGKEKAAAVAAALKEPVDPHLRPSQLVPPLGRVAWVIDLGAADVLLHEAVPAPQ